jgi:HEPN domain-containing protein
LAAIEVLYQRQSWADVVRESQEAIELALKGLLRAIHVEPPRIHDVSDVLLEQRAQLPKALQAHADRFATISRQLRRDRELAFYGTEDLTPSEFYKEADAKAALEDSRWLVETVVAALEMV